MEELTDDEAFVKAAIYGQPGTGKTSFGVTAPDPLFLLSERQGFTHIKKLLAASASSARPRC